MTDRELLEFAAKAAGYQIEGEADKLVVFPEHFAGGFSIFNEFGGSSLWNPLTDDGDALRLAVKLGMSLHSFPDHHQGAQCVVTMTRHAVAARAYADDCNGDLTAATRRAIVRAAAAIGKDLP